MKKASQQYVRAGKCFLALCALVSALHIHVPHAQAFAGGTGSANDPYQIATCADLQAMNTGLSNSYVLNNDIDCTATATWNPQCDAEDQDPPIAFCGFIPIGEDSPFFTGTLEGNNHKIRNLFIYKNQASVKPNTGLFSRTLNARISNLGLESLNVHGDSNVGGLVGRADNTSVYHVWGSGAITAESSEVGGLIGIGTNSTTTKSYYSGTVYGNNDMGGIIGGNWYSEVHDSHTGGTVTGNGSSDGLGGLVGDGAYNTVIRNSYSTSTVVGNTQVGGLVGILIDGARVNNSYSTGDVTGDQWVGGFLGRAGGNVLVNDSYSTGDANGTDSVGGFAGEFGSDGTLISRSFSTGNATGDTQVAGFIGVSADLGTSISNSYWFEGVGSPAHCYTAGGNGGDANCTKKNAGTGGLSYFYNILNAPISSWSFSIWSNANNTISYPPILDVIPPFQLSISSVSADSSTQLTVNANTAVDFESGLHATPYWFTETSGNPGTVSSSTAWQVSGVFVATGLNPNTQYTYKVKARDAAGNQSATTTAVSKYTLAPSPTGLAGSPSAASISVSADSFNNAAVGSSGYYFSRSGANSGWIQANSWSDTGLACNTSYSYSVKYRNADGVETSAATASVSTSACASSGGGGGSSSSGATGSSVSIQQYLNPSAITTRTQAATTTPAKSLVATGFSRDLAAGATGNDVKLLQRYLNFKGFLIAPQGAGSPGHETLYFGALTRQALARFQKANKISPAAGYFGPITRTFIALHP